MRQRCGLTSNYFDHLLLLLLTMIGADGELLKGQDRKLFEYHLTHGCTITVCMRLRGGSLTPIPGLIRVTTNHDDMLGLSTNSREKKAIMPCGHVIS